MRARKSRNDTSPAAAIKTPNNRRAKSNAEKPRLSMHFPFQVAPLRVQDHLTELLALFQPFMRCRCLAQRKAFVDHWFDLAGEDMFHHFVKIAHGPHE